MLRRQSTKAKPDLKRSKSASSAQGVRLEHLDAALAQRDAHAAAQQAFTRAQRDRSSADMSLFPRPQSSSPRRSEADSRSRYGEDSPSQDKGSSKELQRRQSVRFVRPPSAPKRSPGKNRGVHARTAHSEANADPFLIQQSKDERGSFGNDAAAGTKSSQCDTRLVPHRPPPSIPAPVKVKDYIDALEAEDEYYTPEDDIASAPSSYRRLCRSRSMFAAGLRTSQDGSLTSSHGAGSTRRLPSLASCHFTGTKSNKENVQPPAPTVLRAPKSMSFLRARSRNESSTCQYGHEDDMVGLREPATAVKTKSSLLFGSKGRKEMRKSLRSGSSNGVIGWAGRGTGQFNTLSGDDGVQGQARKVSKSWKLKLKNLFRMSKSESDTVQFPSQHIEARKTHVSEAFGSVQSSHGARSVFGGGEATSLGMVPSKLPSLHAVPSIQSFKSRQGSLESVRDRERKPSDDHSLTSWSNSGPSTLTSQQQNAWREWERQRLSVIKENGAHAPSPSLKRPGLDPSLLRPVPEGSPTPRQDTEAPVVDSQRVYSALMKKLEETKQMAHMVEQQRKSSIGSANSVRFEATGEALLSHVDAAPPTIRCVIPEESIFGASGEDRTPTKPGNARYQFELASLSSQRTDQGSNLTGHVVDSTTRPSPGDKNTLAPPVQLFPSYDNGENGARAIADRHSAFFGSPTSHLFRTTSPYRRALQKSMQEDEVKAAHDRSLDRENSSSDNGTQLHHASSVPSSPLHDCREGSGSLADLSVDYSESVYSRASEDKAQAKTSLGDNMAEFPSSLGDACVSVDPPVTYHPTGHRVNSSVSSVDWKTWLSANVAKLEPFSTPVKTSEIEYVLPSMPNSISHGHVREAAQIHEDDETDNSARMTPQTRMPTLPTTPLSAVEPNVVRISPFQRSVKRMTPPSLSPPPPPPPRSDARHLPENESFGSSPPPIPVRSARRPSPSPSKRPGQAYLGMTGSHPFSAAPSITSSPGLSAAVQRQFGPTSRYVGLAAALDQAASPASSPDHSSMLRSRRQGVVGGDESSRVFV